jgi:hypothetical protein
MVSLFLDYRFLGRLALVPLGIHGGDVVGYETEVRSSGIEERRLFRGVLLSFTACEPMMR